MNSIARAILGTYLWGRRKLLRVASNRPFIRRCLDPNIECLYSLDAVGQTWGNCGSERKVGTVIMRRLTSSLIETTRRFDGMEGDAPRLWRTISVLFVSMEDVKIMRTSTPMPQRKEQPEYSTIRNTQMYRGPKGLPSCSMEHDDATLT